MTGSSSSIWVREPMVCIQMLSSQCSGRSGHFWTEELQIGKTSWRNMCLEKSIRFHFLRTNFAKLCWKKSSTFMIRVFLHDGPTAWTTMDSRTLNMKQFCTRKWGNMISPFTTCPVFFSIFWLLEYPLDMKLSEKINFCHDESSNISFLGNQIPPWNPSSTNCRSCCNP